MKYYVIEQTKEKGKVVQSNRITGSTEDLSWAQKQMNFCFDQKVISYRHNIVPGGVSISSDKCSLKLKNNKEYIVKIKKENVRHLKAHEVIIALSLKHAGDFNMIYDDLLRHNTCCEELEQIFAESGSESKAITLLDDDYPTRLKQIWQPPFAFYYKGDKTLLSNNRYKHITIIASDGIPSELVKKIIKDVAHLPSHYVICTTSSAIVPDLLTLGRKIIYMKQCGINMTNCADGDIDPYWQARIILHGGLVLSQYPLETPACLCLHSDFNRAKILCGLSGNTMIAYLSKKDETVINSVLGGILENNGNIMVYPTFPEYKSSQNNAIIANGAYLVENAKDILQITEQ